MLWNGVDTFRCDWWKWLWNCVFPSLEATQKVSIKHWILDHHLLYLMLWSRFVEYFLPTEHYSKSFPIQQFPSPASLCAAILHKFSRKNLLSSKLSTSIINRPPEAQFQDKWYCAFYSVVGHGVAISSKWSSDGDGRIDFRVKDPAWGFELLVMWWRLTKSALQSLFTPGQLPQMDHTRLSYGLDHFGLPAYFATEI